MKNIFLLLILIAISSTLVSQSNRIDDLNTQLNQQVAFHPALNENLDLSVNDLSIQDFLRGVAKQHKLNITVQGDIDGNITNNFYNAKITDVFLFLCEEYKLDIEFIGSVILFKKYSEPIKIEKPIVKTVDVKFDSVIRFLSMDLRKDSILSVARAITMATGENIIVEQSEKDKFITAFIQNRPLEDALNKMAYANNLELEKTEDNFFILKKRVIERPENDKTNTRNRKQQPVNSFNYQVKDGLVMVEAIEVPLNEVISTILNELRVSYTFYDKPTEPTTFFVDNLPENEFLSYILKGTKYSFAKNNDMYLIGNHDAEGLSTTKLIQLENRTIESVKNLIPTNLQKDLFIQEYTDLNGYIVSGSAMKINQLQEAIHQIDVITPMISIEVMIVETTRSNSISGGVSASIGNQNSSTSTGTLSPGVNVDLGTTAINDIINTINGFGAINLGNVGPNFNLKIEALEANQKLTIKSTPKIATLNGQEATLSIGATEYYLEVNNQIVNAGGGTQNILQAQQYKPVKADLSIGIKPFVSSDEQVTLNIDVVQSNFTARISENAPPGTVSRNFKSIVRVKNGEMILLGGLEENTNNNSGSGLPWISRVPVLKWIFGKRIKEKSKKKLSIFIRPTVTY